MHRALDWLEMERRMVFFVVEIKPYIDKLIHQLTVNNIAIYYMLQVYIGKICLLSLSA